MLTGGHYRYQKAKIVTLAYYSQTADGTKLCHSYSADLSHYENLRLQALKLCYVGINCFRIARFRDGQYLRTCIGNTYRAVHLYRYRFSMLPM